LDGAEIAIERHWPLPVADVICEKISAVCNRRFGSNSLKVAVIYKVILLAISTVAGILYKVIARS
jgi:hypothetical protein